MSKNKDLLKEAIADAKAVKDMAIENAKLTLEEAFTPQLKSMLSAKLQEMEREEELDETVSVEGEDDLNLESILREMEDEDSEISEAENEDENEATSVNEEDEDETEGDAEGDDEAESIDLENMTDDDLTKLIADTVSAMVADGELELDGSGETEEMEDEMVGSEDEEEINLEALLAEIDALDENEETEDDLDEGLGSFFKGLVNKIKGSVTGFDEFAQTEHYANFMNKYSSNGELDQEKVTSAGDQYRDDVNRLGAIYQQWVIKAKNLDPSVARNDMNDLKSSLGNAVKRGSTSSEFPEIAETESEELYETKEKLNEALAVIDAQKKELDGINLINAKLLYVNRIFKAKNLSESQKLRVIGTFDKASNVSEVKLVYETMNGSLKSKTKTNLNESKGSASKSISSTGSSRKPIVEVEDAFARMNEIAFFTSKH